MRAWPLVALLAVACGKSSVGDVPPSQRWDAPTPANGFRPLTEPCRTIDAAGKIHDSPVGTLEEIAGDADRVLATDPRFVYYVTEKRTIHRAERATAPWPKAWRDETLFTSEHGSVVDLAVSAARIYWVVDEGGAQGGGPQRLYAADKTALARTLVRTFDRPIARLFGRKTGVVFSSPRGAEQIDDDGGPTMQADGERVLGATDDDTFVATHGGFLSAVPRQPWRATVHITAADEPIAAAADSMFVYWLERGKAGAAPVEKESCTTGYQLARAQPAPSAPAPAGASHPVGKLRRVARGGGTAADLFVGIPDPESLTVAKGIVWISTAHGLLRYDPSCHLAPVRIAGGFELHGRAAPFGEGLAVVTESPSPRVALLAAP